MKFSMTGQEKGDLLIEVTSWAQASTITFFQTCPFGNCLMSKFRNTSVLGGH
jgi:hypothetical protein